MAGISFFDSKECAWKDQRVYISGAPVVKITGIKFKSSMEKELLHVEGDEPISIQAGNRKYEGSLTLLKGAVDTIHDAAVAAGGTDALDISFDVVIKYKAQGTRRMRLVTLEAVEITDLEYGWEQGAKQMPITMPILFLGATNVPV